MNAEVERLLHFRRNLRQHGEAAAEVEAAHDHRHAESAKLTAEIERARRLGGDHDPGQIDLDLLAEIGQRQFKKRPGEGDAGIVDQAEELFASQSLADARRRQAHGILIGHVENERYEGTAELGRKPLRIVPLAHAAEHAEAARNQHLGGVPQPMPVDVPVTTTLCMQGSCGRSRQIRHRGADGSVQSKRSIIGPCFAPPRD
jgi:hypothetical protein